jgi:glycine/D-amino acid oxidase-like deaminating enzyme
MTEAAGTSSLDELVPNPSQHNQWYPFLDRPLPPDGDLRNPAVIPVTGAVPLPPSAKYVVVGAGVHGLSTAYHLAMLLERTGKGKGADVVLIDKQGPGAGATGLACGCVRNLYMTGPLHAILRASVEVWESDPVNFGFQQVGYVSIGEANQEADYVNLHASQNASGYPSDLYTGGEAHEFLLKLWPDFKTDNCDVVLHEHRSGYAGTHMAVWGLDQKCRQWGVQRVYGVEVTGYATDASGSAVTAVETTQGSIECDEVIIGAGAWTPTHWEWLGQPDNLDVVYPDGHIEKGADMWTYWRLLEGEVFLPEGVDFRTADGKDSPVLHVELMNTPVFDADGKMILDHVYTYTRYAAERVGAPGLQGGTIPIKLGPKAAVEPYGHLNDLYQADDWFPEYYTATLGMLFKRFENLLPYYKNRRNGGIGAFTPDNVPVFDHVKDNVWMIADSNHGFKMIGVGKLSAQMLVHGVKPDELKPFTMERYANGGTFGDRNSNCPWV